MASKQLGTVKWFSNRKGYGFLATTLAGSDTEDEIFVHHSSIVAPEGSYRTLAEGAQVAFDVEKEADTDKLKAINVTDPSGSPLEPPPRESRRQNTRSSAPRSEPSGAGGEKAPSSKPSRNGKPSTNGPKKEKEPPFHAVLLDEVKQKVEARGLDLHQKSTVDIAVGDARIKLGQGGYAGLAEANGTVAEGTYDCNEMGDVTLKWERSLTFSDGEWKLGDPAMLIQSISLTDEQTGPVHVDDTPAKLWGAETSDPKEEFEKHGFMMRRVVLTRPPRGGARKTE